MSGDPLGARVSRLKNGVRIASAFMPHLQGVCVGVWALVGGRHEKREECGIAHFLEHLLFKGTTKRSARELTLAVEGVGGYLNAFTTEDHTCYYAKAAAVHFERIGEVLLEMYSDSQFPENEVRREREVIREEILSGRDVPSQWVEDLLSESLWPGHPLGRSLTGTEESIARLGRRALRGFRDRHYTGANTVVTVAGSVEHAQVLEVLGGGFGALSKGKSVRSSRLKKAPRFELRVEEADSEQSHVALGFHAYGRTDPRRYAARLLSVLLGENMSSRLFQVLRERHGYCYSVQSSTVFLEETGAVSIFADLDPAKLPGALKLLRREFERLRERRVSKGELRRAQEYVIGQARISLDSATQRNAWMAESLMAHGRVVSPGEVEAGILAVDPAMVQGVAREVLTRNRMGAAFVGPGYGKGEMERLLMGF
ncbi:MAG: hypothetical protein RLZZ142_2858 [Verrucomicrobiota bacterium]